MAAVELFVEHYIRPAPVGFLERQAHGNYQGVDFIGGFDVKRFD